MTEKWEFYVAGVQHHQLKYCIGNVEEGDEIHIVPEPTNLYDYNAVQLHWKGEDTDFMVGFVPKKKDMNVQVSASLEIGTNLRCKVVKLDRSAKPWEQLRVVIEEIEDEQNG